MPVVRTRLRGRSGVSVPPTDAGHRGRFGRQISRPSVKHCPLARGPRTGAPLAERRIVVVATDLISVDRLALGEAEALRVPNVEELANEFEGRLGKVLRSPGDKPKARRPGGQGERVLRERWTAFLAGVADRMAPRSCDGSGNSRRAFLSPCDPPIRTPRR